MSIQCGYACLDCRVLAPNVGDGGYLGAPALESLEMVDSDGGAMPSFGYFYEALDGIGIRPYDLMALRDFLGKHHGHRLNLDAGQGDHPEIAGLGSDVLDRYLEEQESEKTRRCASRELRDALFEMSCTKCGESVAASDAELLQHYEPFCPSAESAALFVERWGIEPDDGWNYRLMGIADPTESFMQELIEFLREHQRHTLLASVHEPA